MQALFDIVERLTTRFLAPLEAEERRAFLSLLSRLVDADQDLKSP
jgi:hypothetical protein